MGRKISEETERKIFELYEEGYTRGEIAKILKINKNTVTSRLGVSKEHEQTRVDTGKIMALRRAGWKAKDIAGDMSLKVETVEKVLKEMSGKGEEEQKMGSGEKEPSEEDTDPEIAPVQKENCRGRYMDIIAEIGRVYDQIEAEIREREIKLKAIADIQSRLLDMRKQGIF